jgi:hypothetical protein
MTRIFLCFQSVSNLCHPLIIGVIRDFRTFTEISIKTIDSLLGFGRMEKKFNPVHPPLPSGSETALGRRLKGDNGGI